jgi:hypothetical protein
MPDPAVFDPPEAAAIGDPSVPTTLANARSRDDARAAHLARIAHVKANIVRVGTAPGKGRQASDPLDVIRRCQVPAERVQQIHTAVHHLAPPSAQPVPSRRPTRNEARP